MGVKRYDISKAENWEDPEMCEEEDGLYVLHSDFQQRDELVRELVEALAKMRGYFNFFAEEGIRPDEWIMREWVAKCDAVLAKANAMLGEHSVGVLGAESQQKRGDL